MGKRRSKYSPVNNRVELSLRRVGKGATKSAPLAHEEKAAHGRVSDFPYPLRAIDPQFVHRRPIHFLPHLLSVRCFDLLEHGIEDFAGNPRWIVGTELRKLCCVVCGTANPYQVVR